MDVGSPSAQSKPAGCKNVRRLIDARDIASNRPSSPFLFVLLLTEVSVGLAIDP